ncbi:MAG: hypothetical protein P8O93_03665 [Flavobacteriaceae bacterium]|nr:hypothetical protein [Flavobacteriaceae bacterium]MDG1962602.1 hypothetical protein [Flavobacteriaceae bacterium]
MNSLQGHTRTRAQESSNAIERIYITMRHLFNRGFYKPMGVSGAALREALLTLRPEIYGSIAEEKIELRGLVYVMDRLPYGIEECQFVNLTSDEGYAKSHVKPIIPPKRRRHCYRIDDQQMNIVITRGRSEIYDILTHLTFLYIESHKIKNRVLSKKGTQWVLNRDWDKLAEAALKKGTLSETQREVAVMHAANFLGRTFEEVQAIYHEFAVDTDTDRFLRLVYFLGKGAVDEVTKEADREITFSPVLRERLGHHIHGERWAKRIKEELFIKGQLSRPLHIISANMHSVMNTLFAEETLPKALKEKTQNEWYEYLSQSQNQAARDKVKAHAQKNGMTYLEDTSQANIDVQIFDMAAVMPDTYSNKTAEAPVLIVMDYAFGEQAYETMDELLKPFVHAGKSYYLPVVSISIMGKAGILQGGKGDIMIPKSHVFEGTADNYPFKNKLKLKHFSQANAYGGAMITVLGTSLQNKDILSFFHNSSWDVIGLEMEGAHYQKAIQAASKIRGSISPSVAVRYAYYASDNPLETGSTLASGGLGTTGVRPTYLITEKIMEQILST